MKKTHFDFFSVETNLLDSKEIQELIQNKGAVSIAVLMYIKSKIFGVGGQGSYLAFDRNVGVKLASMTLNIKQNSVIEIINYACNRGIFDKYIYTQYEVLTSERIQLEYIELCKRTKRKDQLNELLPYDLIGHNDTIKDKNNEEVQQLADVPTVVLSTDENKEKNSKADKINYQAFANAYNTNCGDSSKVQKLTKSRKNAIKGIMKEFTYEDIKNAFAEINNSNFLQGENARGWKMTFDWFLNKKNFVKILEGNYRNKVTNEKFNKTTNTRSNNGKNISTEYIEGVLRDLQS